ncbi:MAG: PD-(D/E)XK nuclease family protein [Nitrospinales bacterium]
MPIPALEEGIVLTAGSRLARWLILRHGERRKNEGLQCWPTPPIFSLADWLKTLWRQSWPERYVLSHLQSVKLWESIIQGGPHAPKPDLLHLRGAAERAAQAYGLIRQYRLPAGAEVFKYTHESETFCGWVKRYEARLNQWRALDPACLPDAVREAMKKGSIPLPERLVLAGFDEITPQLHSLLDFLRSSGVAVQDGPPQSSADEVAKDRRVEVREYTDRQQEAIQCARWIRERHQPGTAIGVVDLNRYDSLLKKELAAELAPQSVFPWREEALPFNFPSIDSLARQPMIQPALSLLSMPGGAIAFAPFAALLTSPFLYGGQSETQARAELDSHLRYRNMNTVCLDRLDTLIDPETAPRLKFFVQSWRELIGDGQRLPPSAWAHHFSGFLRRIGWPAGDGSWTANMRWTHRVWMECLDALASLDGVMGSIDRLAAAGLLSQITEEKPFHLKTDDQLIQVVGLEDSAGLAFDHLWVMGCNADVLPASPSPNPFLPLPLQKKLPHATGDWELKFAERVLRRLLGAAPDIVFSFPGWDGEAALRMSPLLKDLPQCRPAPEITCSHRMIDQLQSPIELQTWRDNPALPFGPDERRELQQTISRQGCNVLRNQAHCPFRAFAQHRLHAEKLVSPEALLDSEESMTRGSLVHKALEIFWKKVKTRTQLQRLKEENRLLAVIHDSVRQAVRKTFDRAVLNRQSRFVELEVERVNALLKDWMERELLRTDFEVILKEKDESVTIGELELNIRIDRMDRVESGQRILIDYKTGQCNTADWFQDRIQEPQLPLYALKFLPDAIAYAPIRKSEKNPGYKLVAGDASLVTALCGGKNARCVDWQEKMDFWRDRLTALADEFLAGRLSINPFRGSKTCRNCGLNSLCRIEEIDNTISDSEEMDE